MTPELRRLLTLVSAIVLVDVLFYSAITPLLPHYVDALGLSKSQAGALAGAYAGGTLLASLPAGFIAARRGSRPTLLIGLALLGSACVAFGVARSFEVLVAARFLQGVGGAASWAAGLSWLIRAAPADRRGQLIGTALGTAIAGAIGGPVVGALAEWLSPQAVFSTMAAIAAVLAALVMSTPPPGRAEEEPVGLRRAALDPRVRVGAWLTLLPALFFGTLGVLVPLHLDDLGTGAGGVAAVFLVAAAVEAAMSPIVGRVSDRRGRLLPLRFGLAGVLVMCLLLPTPDRAFVVGAFLALGAASAGMLWTPAMALLSDGAEGVGLPQGIAFGVVNLAWAGGQVAGAAGGSALAEATSDTVPFAVLAVLCAATLAVLFRHGRAAATAAAV